MKNCSSEVVYKELFTNQWTSDLSTAQKDTHDPKLLKFGPTYIKGLSVAKYLSAYTYYCLTGLVIES